MASATVIGLAIGFGLQGVVQDVVTGLTFIFSDLIDVDDLVDISGQVGIVKAITMRFIELENALGATVFIPNRTVNNIINYPRGYVRCIVDVTLNGTQEQRNAVVELAEDIVESVHQQFPGIFITKPSLEGRITLNDIKEILRIKFRIWPNRGQPIETTFVKELSEKIKESDSKYEPWMIAISYEVEKKKEIDLKKFRWIK